MSFMITNCVKQHTALLTALQNNTSKSLAMCKNQKNQNLEAQIHPIFSSYLGLKKKSNANLSSSPASLPCLQFCPRKEPPKVRDENFDRLLAEERSKHGAAQAPDGGGGLEDVSFFRTEMEANNWKTTKTNGSFCWKTTGNDQK